MMSLNAYIHKLDEAFDLVMIFEKYEESLVLLKDLLCWKFEDMTYKIVNRAEKAKTTLSQKAQMALRGFLRQEYDLYNHFRARFEEKVRKMGAERMRAELTFFSFVTSSTQIECQAQCKIRKQCQVTLLNQHMRHCPCKGFNFCSNCVAKNMTDGLRLNVWANCLQNRRFESIKEQRDVNKRWKLIKFMKHMHRLKN